ncbi:glycosyltransferase family 4 protein [Kallotenue papyrolyticum]|uniref:glycosyltransferase family 4 protein n=1 Tax=Kallotenue papyrolyticum TaxID=1325125 RepID=UPI000492CA7D|nr:glycosyltransferase family 1 protein [Kallotenue papyrolyticum]
MNIVLDAHMLGTQEGGNETYVAGLMRGFAALADCATRVIAVCPSCQIPAISNRHLEYVPLRTSGNFSRLLLELPSVCRRFTADLLHVTYNAPLFVRTPTVVSVHDVIFRRFPSYFSPRVRLLLSTWLPLSMMRAARVVTLSEASKRDIIHYYPFTRNKIEVIPPAAGPLVALEPDFDGAKQFTGGEPFILAVGTLQPRKNIARLIKAYLRLRHQTGLTAKLVIVGKAAWQHSHLYQLAASTPYRQDIIFTGYISDATLAALYRTCTVFVYPSLYEGFGLPVIEAMALGAPVITSNTSSLPEAAGDGAMLVDPYSEQAISDALNCILTNADVRQALRHRGRQQAARFSWEHTAVQTLQVYKEVVQQRHSSTSDRYV